MTQRAPAFILVFFLADVALSALYLADRALGSRAWKVTALIDLAGHGNAATWYISAQLFLLAFLLGLFAQHMFDWRVVPAWFLPVFPLLFAVLSCEEIAAVHTWVGYKSARLFPPGALTSNTFYYRDLAWVGAVGGPLILLGLGYCVRRYTNGHPQITRKYVVGALLYVGASVGLGILSVSTSAGTSLRVLGIAIETLGRTVGLTTMLWATSELLIAHGISFAGRAYAVRAR